MATNFSILKADFSILKAEQFTFYDIHINSGRAIIIKNLRLSSLPEKSANLENFNVTVSYEND